LNEDGLPFLEIRETSDQRDELVIEAASVAEASISTTLPDSQYWSEAAKKRRADLLRKVLGDDEDADKTENEDIEVVDKAQALTAGSVSNPSSPSQTDNSSKPKSILKPPARKKSVSFEEDEAASNMKNTPSLKTFDKPTSPKSSVLQPTGSFAGFKRGFLSSPLKQEVRSNPVPQIVELPSTDPSPASISSTSSSALKMESSPASSPAPKKKSLFALRKAQMTAPKTEAPVLPEKVAGKPAPVIGKTPHLPKASSSKPMSSMKYSVVERALEKPAAKPARRAKTESDSDMSEYSDLDDDDMDIDQALLAREVALEYHKRRSMIPLHNDEGTLEGDEWDRETGQGRWSSDRQASYKNAYN
jgi:CTD nuclear envelope phosphatase 1